MKISKRQLKRIIREEKRRIREMHGDVVVDVVGAEPAIAPVLESTEPVEDVLVEMEVASRALETVVESVQNAAQLCPTCGSGVAEQTPIVEALALQAAALQEMVEAQTAVIQENAELGAPILDAVLDAVV
jgi:hypothetical protein